MGLHHSIIPPLKCFLLLTLTFAACVTPPAAAVETFLQTPPSPTRSAPPVTVAAPAVAASTEAPARATATAPPAAIPTQPLAPDCTETKGTVTNHNYHAYALGYSLFYNVYLPPCYDQSGDEYPVLYLLHGKSFIEDQWDRLGADEAADELIAAGDAAPFIMIMPRGGANPYFGQGLVKDLMPYVETAYRIRRDRAHRAIGGLSRGAGWALYLGLSHPDLFGTIGAHSPAILRIHAPEMDNLLDALPPDESPRLALDIGDKDSLITNTEWFTEMLDERGIPYAFNLYPGQHDEAYWSAHVRDYIRFYAGGW